MREKLKVTPSSVTKIIKSSLLGVVITILSVLLFAFILKFVDLSSSVITIIDNVIKIISIFVAVLTLSKSGDNRLLLKGVAVGILYSIITFVIFSILNGGINFSVAIFTDIAFSAIVGMTSAILLNIIAKK